MSFVKLDCGVLDSSLWVESAEVRVVFVTMLAMCSSEGLVEATAPGIARRANLPLATVRRAIKRLESPDPDDRSGVEDGRRIKRVPGGYSVVNYLAYRAKDHTAVERKRRQRERERGMSRVTSRPVTQGEGEGEAEVEADRPIGEGGEIGSPDIPPAQSLDQAATTTGNGALTGTADLATALLKGCQAIARETGSSITRVVERVSRIEAGNGHPEKSFSDPRAKGISREWLEASLCSMYELRASILRPPPL